MGEHELAIHFNPILINEMKKHLSLNLTEMPPDLSHKSAAKGEGEAAIKSALYGCDKTAGVRIGTNIIGGSMYVEFGVIPPGENYDFPILGYDFVNSKKCLIAVFDFHPLRNDDEYYKTYVAPLGKIISRYRNIPTVEGGRTESREWAKFYNSGFGFYRWCERTFIPQVEHAFREYTALFSELIKNATPIEDPDRKKNRDTYMQKYKEDYIANDPGGGPLKHLFGEEWAEEYMGNFLFK